MQAGILIGSAGRGPGSGIRASAPAVAMMIIATMASDNLADLVVSVEQAASRTSQNGRCPLTGAANFGDALTLVLASEATAASVRSINLNRNTLSSEILFDEHARKHPELSSFGQKFRRYSNSKALEIEARLAGTIVQAIASDLARIAAGKRVSVRTGETAK